LFTQLKPPSAISFAGGGFARLLLAAFILATTGCSAPAERVDAAPRRSLIADTVAASAPLPPLVPTPLGVPCIVPRPDGAIRVSADSVGPLPSRLTYAELRARCPAARDTFASGYEYVGPALVIPTPPGIIVVAHQAVPMVLDSADEQSAGEPVPNGPIDYWTLGGAAIELPGGSRGSARWAELVRRYGPVMIITELSRLDARFCRLPDFGFVINAYDHAGARDNFEMLDSLSPGVDPNGTIAEITLAPDGSPGSRPDAARCRGPGKR
jgi:hypothetical protein